VDHSSDGEWLDAMADDLARSDPRWSRRWRFAEALLPGRSPSWTGLAASGALLVAAAVLLLVSVTSGQRWLLVLVVAVWALGLWPVARSARGVRLPPLPARTARHHHVTRDERFSDDGHGR
jgi:hypothetical protein